MYDLRITSITRILQIKFVLLEMKPRKHGKNIQFVTYVHKGLTNMNIKD